MFRAAIIATLLLLAPAAVQAGQGADERYSACLVGNSVIGTLLDDLAVADAYERSVGLCSDLADKASDPALAEDNAIHFIDNVFVPALNGVELQPAFEIE